MAKTMLITGGSRGIGAATARMAADHGYDVALTYKSSKAEADKVAADIRAKGRRALVIQADAGKEEDALRTFAEFKKEFGAMDVLVYNAGISGVEYRLDEAPTAILKETLDINLFGCMIHSREAVKVMSTRHGGKGGNIVLIGSRAADYGSPSRYIWYAASKGGVRSFTVGPCPRSRRGRHSRHLRRARPDQDRHHAAGAAGTHRADHRAQARRANRKKSHRS